VIGIVVVVALVVAWLAISRAAEREQGRVDEARAAARPGRATVVEVTAANSAVTSPGLRREGYRFVLDVADDGDGDAGGGPEPALRRVSEVFGA